MENKENNGIFYEITEVGNELVFQIYGKNNKSFVTFRIFSTFKRTGIKLLWLLALLFSPFYVFVLIFDTLILAVFSFFIVVAILYDANIFVIILISFTLTFVYTFAVGCFFNLLDPKLGRRKRIRQSQPTTIYY
jgi:hypothetical protein